MKWMIASDIHGSAYYCRRLLERYEKENAGRLLLLGDLLYHGPRNDLPEEYNPKAVSSLLNSVKSELLCVRGNCDAEVDQMMLNFPMMADYMVLDLGDKLLYATHGQIYNKEHLLPLKAGDILLYGHTHIPECTEQNGITIMNPGSVSIPKADTSHGYMVLENNHFLWKDLDGNDFRP